MHSEWMASIKGLDAVVCTGLWLPRHLADRGISSTKLESHGAAGCKAVIRTGERDILDCWQPHFQGGAASGAHPVSPLCLELYRGEPQ